MTHEASSSSSDNNNNNSNVVELKQLPPSSGLSFLNVNYGASSSQSSLTGDASPGTISDSNTSSTSQVNLLLNHGLSSQQPPHPQQQAFQHPPLASTSPHHSSGSFIGGSLYLQNRTNSISQSGGTKHTTIRENSDALSSDDASDDVQSPGGAGMGHHPPHDHHSVNVKDIETKSNKSAATSSKTKRSGSSGRSGSATGSDAIRIHTRCGTFELSWLKVLSLMSLIVNLIAFLVLGGLILAGYLTQSDYSTNWFGLDTDTSYYREMMVASCRAAVFSNSNPVITANYSARYYDWQKKFTANAQSVQKRVPPSLQYTVSHNISVMELRTSKAVATEFAALALAGTGNYSTAMTLIESDVYKFNLEGYSVEFQPMVNYVKSKRDEGSNYSLLVTTISLVVICVSLLVVIPTVVASIGLSLRKDSVNTKKLQKVKAHLLMDTMKDNKLRELFKAHCKQELSLENFLLLDKITDYKKLCERSFEIQVYLYDNDQTTSDATSEGGLSVEQPKKKKKGFTEKDLINIEKKKYEIAFEIYSDFLEVNGEHSVNLNKQMIDRVKEHLDFFATGQNEHLADGIFDGVENEICILMLDTHARFVQSVQFQKQLRKEALTTFKITTLKKNKNATNSQSK
ncbi:hypothetical protein FDP41_010455 [Naegleria fowleri]|uniref:RGS domain-containing protein n=1 Tax=Naegleria fowleri TaxID=5763 RepID=A0A6A5CCR7_NAEFO|nr:uncharacterized protein FDP41_010455 [Naegleria fowleri]KAF0983390.1 hypothetical protein FDP41_010455 [Naegleria fowleri]CAG4713802.1 unnamed protein product [Naegleria fowleri]